MMDGLDEKAFGGAWITWSANFLAEKEKLGKNINVAGSGCQKHSLIQFKNPLLNIIRLAFTQGAK